MVIEQGSWLENPGIIVYLAENTGMIEFLDQSSPDMIVTVSSDTPISYDILQD